MGRRAVDNSELERWRTVDVTRLFGVLLDYSKQDEGFRPRCGAGTTRWNVSVGATELELLCTGAKFFDTRAGAGGAGAVDFAMYVLGLPFKDAVRLLRTKGL